jgi:sodium transport system permease protein
MKALFVVFAKEFLENLRDRRTVLSALVLGPLGAPLLFAVMMNLTLERNREHDERPLELAVSGRAAAPNLVAFLAGEGVHLVDLPADVADAATAVRTHRTRLALVIPEGYGARLERGEPARVLLYSDQSDTSTAAERARAAGLLGAYSARIATWRLAARGLSPAIAQPVVVDDVDVSTPAARATSLFGMLSYFIVFATLMGGIYIAIDATAGERERGSLEPLLTLPLPRATLVAGKILAACAYMALSLVLTVTTCAISLRFVHVDQYGMQLDLGPATAAAIVAVMLPFVPLGAALLTLVASFTRSYREAQSWLSALVLVPTMPILFASVYQVAPRLGLMWVPSLSQHLLIQSLLRGDALGGASVALSASVTLGLGALLALLAARLYAREKILG